MWLTKFALRQPVLVTLFFVSIAVFGLIGYTRMDENVLPPVTFPFVSVTIVYPGASPFEIERLIVEPLEDQLQNVPHLDRTTANVLDGSAVVGVRLKLGADQNAAIGDVQHAVDAARANLPTDLLAPIVEGGDLSVLPILTETVSSSVLSTTALSSVVNDVVVRRLKATSSIGSVQVQGDFQRRLTVEPDLGKLQSVGGTLLDVNRAVAAANTSLPGGLVSQPFQEVALGVRSDMTSAAKIASAPLVLGSGPDGQLRVSDVARVTDGYADHRIAASVDGSGAIVLLVARDAGSSTAAATDSARKTFAALADEYPLVDFHELIADASYTSESLRGVMENLVEGIFLTALVLLAFFREWRSAAIVAIAIPSSLCATFLCMWLLGFTVNVLSLMGLSLTIGILVDDSIVVIENIVRHFSQGKDATMAAVDGRSEIGGAAIAITLVDVIVYAPLAFMSGIIGDFMKEFGLVVVVATLFSLLVSFTVTPLLAARWSLIRRARSLRPPSYPWWLRQGIWPAIGRLYSQTVRFMTQAFDGTKDAYVTSWLPWALAHRKLVVAVCAVATAASFVPIATGAIPSEFQPATQRGVLTVDLSYRPGTPMQTTQTGALRLERAIGAVSGVRHVLAVVGRNNDGSSDVIGGHVAQLSVVLTDAARTEEDVVAARVRTMADLVPGADIAIHGFQMGGKAPISYEVVGADDDKLALAAAKIAGLIARNPVARDVHTSLSESGPRMDVLVDQSRASLLRVSPDDVANTVRTAVAGATATRVRFADQLVDAVVRLPASMRVDPQSVTAGVDVRAQTGRTVPVGDVATVRWSTEPAVLQRDDRRRVVSVTATTLGGEPVGLVTGPVSAALQSKGFLPAGISVLPRGDVEQMKEAGADIGLALLTSCILMYIVLAVLYQGYAMPFIVLLTVPIASVGAFGSLWLANVLHAAMPQAAFFDGQTINLYSMLGIVMLIGLVAKNGILLVDYANTLRRSGISASEAMRQSAAVRFRPILMTTASMIAGMLPLALGLTAGAEMRKAMGTVVIGGLASSLVLTLFLIPAIYVRFAGARATRRTEEIDRSVEPAHLGFDHSQVV